MTLSLQELELVRARWRRNSGPLGMSLESQQFASEGLAAHVQDLSVRFLVSPFDPERVLISFDEDFWSWFVALAPEPFTGRGTDWGGVQHPGPDAAIRHDHPHTDDRSRWGSHLAITRAGGLEFALGANGGYRSNEHKTFNLIEIVGRIWVALEICIALRERYQLEGPSECVLALRDTADADLGHLGQGWTEPENRFRDSPPKCHEANLLFRHELEGFGIDTAQRIAFHFGERIEDAWGARQRRFLANRGDLEGQFDWAKYSGEP